MGLKPVAISRRRHHPAQRTADQTPFMGKNSKPSLILETRFGQGTRTSRRFGIPLIYDRARGGLFPTPIADGYTLVKRHFQIGWLTRIAFSSWDESRRFSDEEQLRRHKSSTGK